MAGSASPARLLLGRLFHRRLVLVALVLLLCIVAAALLAPWISPFAPERMAVARRLRPPSEVNWLGTDEFGRDVLSRCIFGARVSLSVGLLVALFSGLLGTLLGVVAGYVRRLDGVLMRIADGMMAFPDILLAIALLAALGPSMFNVVLALGIVYAPRVARIARGGTLVLRELQFIEAADALGSSRLRVILVHLLPNLLSPLLVQATFIFGWAILTEAALSFLGAGVPPTQPSWGNMIAGAQLYIGRADWLLWAPGVAIVLTVLSLQLLGDGLRDALDPKLRRVG